MVNNHATSSGGLSGNAANFTLQNTILADNTADVSGPNCASGFTSQGYNLIDNASGCIIAGQAASDIIGQDARLAPLDLNDGSSLTQGVLGGSPAIDHGACVLSTDQRSVARPQDGDLDQVAACDIGAFEFVPEGTFLPLIVK